MTTPLDERVEAAVVFGTCVGLPTHQLLAEVARREVARLEEEGLSNPEIFGSFNEHYLESDIVDTLQDALLSETTKRLREKINGN